MCMAQPEAVSQAKPGQNGGFVTALAWPGVLESQSQAVRPWFWQATGGHLFVEICGLRLSCIIKL